MIRIFLFLIIIVAVAFWLFKPGGSDSDAVRTSKSWLKAGGLLGLLILVARITHVPLAYLLKALPFIIPSFKRAAEAQAKEHAQNNQPSGMSAEEARLILGVGLTADNKDITAAHRKLITQNHPDKGGSDYLAAKINQARDVLLG